MKEFTRSDFGFDLPQDLIAQSPVFPREKARLLHFSRDTKTVDHRHFFNLAEILRPGDVLVFNDSKVMKARLFGVKETGGAVEVFLLHPTAHHYKDVESQLEWAALIRGKVRAGTEITFGGGFSATIDEVVGDGTVQLKLSAEASKIMEAEGHTPIPPYILKDAPLKDYQNVYAKEPGSVAAPTAGLHFSDELLEQLQERGVEFAYVTLHVGAGTFLPVKHENLADHPMHSEYGVVTEETAKQLNRAHDEGRRIIAVGTTATRTLESSVTDGVVKAGAGWTDIFITPGYEFQVIDGLITNFHLPHSTLLMLVSALAGYEEMMDIYKEAIAERYRFYSFGDGMLID